MYIEEMKYNERNNRKLKIKTEKLSTVLNNEVIDSIGHFDNGIEIKLNGSQVKDIHYRMFEIFNKEHIIEVGNLLKGNGYCCIKFKNGLTYSFNNDWFKVIKVYAIPQKYPGYKKVKTFEEFRHLFGTPCLYIKEKNGKLYPCNLPVNNEWQKTDWKCYDYYKKIKNGGI